VKDGGNGSDLEINQQTGHPSWSKPTSRPPQTHACLSSTLPEQKTVTVGFIFRGLEAWVALALPQGTPNTQFDTSMHKRVRLSGWKTAIANAWTQRPWKFAIPPHQKIQRSAEPEPP
jgi:hypothetical protein